MKSTVAKVKDVRGRITSYSASIGPIKVSAETPKEAVMKCEQSVIGALGRLDRGPEIARWRGHTYVVAPTVDGWFYWLDTFSSIDYRCHIVGAREEAVDAALHHLAQQLWTQAVDDAAFVIGLPSGVAKTIVDWIGFQRRYAKHKESGKNDIECHRLACEGVT